MFVLVGCANKNLQKQEISKIDFSYSSPIEAVESNDKNIMVYFPKIGSKYENNQLMTDEFTKQFAQSFHDDIIKLLQNKS